MKDTRQAAIIARDQPIGAALLYGEMTHPHRLLVPVEWHMCMGVCDCLALISPNTYGSRRAVRKLNFRVEAICKEHPRRTRLARAVSPRLQTPAIGVGVPSSCAKAGPTIVLAPISATAVLNFLIIFSFDLTFRLASRSWQRTRRRFDGPAFIRSGCFR